MQQFPEVIRFAAQLNEAHDLEALGNVIEVYSRYLGFDYFSIGHHAKAASSNLLHISNYPSSWSERLSRRPYLSDDPAVLACQNTNAGFLWSDIDRLITLSKRQKKFLAEMQNSGLGEGFTVPVHLPSECGGSCNFVAAPGKSVAPSILPTAQYAGCLAFEAGRRLIRNSDEKDSVRAVPQVPRLSARQFDCIVLVAQGKSNTDVAQLLGISSQTVHHHIEAAKRRYGVATRTQLIVRALFDGQLMYEDIIRH